MESVLIDHFIAGWLGCGINLTINDCGLGFERRSWRFTEKNSMPIKCNQSKYKKAMKTISLQKITSNNHYLIHNSTQVQQIGYSHQRRRLSESSFQLYKLLNCKPFQSLTSITCSPPPKENNLVQPVNQEWGKEKRKCQPATSPKTFHHKQIEL